MRDSPPPPTSSRRCHSSTFSPVSSFAISKKPFPSRAHMCRHFFQEPRRVQLPGFWSHLTCLMAPSRETRWKEGGGERRRKRGKEKKKRTDRGDDLSNRISPSLFFSPFRPSFFLNPVPRLWNILDGHPQKTCGLKWLKTETDSLRCGCLSGPEKK